MASSDYAAVTSGALKLKGGSGIDKKRKKKKRSKPASTPPANPATEHQDDPTTEHQDDLDPTADPDKQRQPKSSDTDLQAILASEDGPTSMALAQASVGRHDKTEAERRHDERRRRRLDERLKREGVKTHKERVEELNRYLSGLSEHHDMPRIGPG
ncbi:DUF1754-domain-containing protein [Lophium mytilinum]|uniref:DUF1754-domain-containing protein n=1 Tax=Lophium mytilinum TaxID=390894 RepID=A0A6A6RDB2_9PEZI|nr:DUF1754-domain-containing protein [Lophium mytilinum]